MDEPLESRVRFLRKVGIAQMPHQPEVGLFDRLRGPRRLLIERPARPALCDAGLIVALVYRRWRQLWPLILAQTPGDLYYSLYAVYPAA